MANTKFRCSDAELSERQRRADDIIRLFDEEPEEAKKRYGTDNAMAALCSIWHCTPADVQRQNKKSYSYYEKREVATLHKGNREVKIYKSGAERWVGGKTQPTVKAEVKAYNKMVKTLTDKMVGALKGKNLKGIQRCYIAKEVNGTRLTFTAFVNVDANTILEIKDNRYPDLKNGGWSIVFPR